MYRWLQTCCALAALAGGWHASAATMAADDASDAVYDMGSPAWANGDNGGSGFGAWFGIGNGVGSGFGGGFIESGGTDIDTGGEAFGIFGNGGGVGQAFRPLTGTLSVGQTFSISMDNQGIDPGGTVGFGLQNASGDNLVEFFFVGGQSNYTVNADNVSGATPGFTFDGLALALTLTDADSFSLAIDLLGNGAGVDNTVTGDLFANADQGIAQFRLFNANGGPNAYFNSVSVVPEPTLPVLASIGGLLLLGYRTVTRGGPIA